MILRRAWGRASVAAFAATVALFAGCTGEQPSSAPTDASSVSTPMSTSTATPKPTATTDASTKPAAWLSYHATDSRTGAIPADLSLDRVTHAWSRNLGAASFAQPVVYGSTAVAALESNLVAALDLKTGKMLWAHRIGAPVRHISSLAGCGNIDPLGITSTPVIDPVHQIVYVVGEVASGGSISHELRGFDLETGKVVRSVNVDPPLPAGQKRVHLLQRVSLALANGRVYVGYGGNIGDCGRYNGWIVAVKQSGAADKRAFRASSNGEGGAIWQSGGAPAVDAEGDVYVATGNANPWPSGPDPTKYGESVVKLSPTLKVLASFKDPAATGDLDLSTGNPVLLPGGLVFAVGKTNIGYLLRQSDLHRVAAIRGVCASDPDGGPAYYAAKRRLFVPCRGGGIAVIDIAKRTVVKTLAGANGAPIVIGNRVWAVSYPDGALLEYNAATGARMQWVDLPAVPNFTTPSSVQGYILVGTKTGLVAYRGTAP